LERPRPCGGAGDHLADREWAASRPASEGQRRHAGFTGTGDVQHRMETRRLLEVVLAAIHGFPESAVLGQPYAFEGHEVAQFDLASDLCVRGVAEPPGDALRTGRGR